MGAYLRQVGPLAHNLARRLAEDLADCAAVCQRGVFYKLRSFRQRYDDVGPTGTHERTPSVSPETLASLVETVQHKPWFSEADRATAHDLVRTGGNGCFLVRPSASTKSLTLTLWYHHRAYSILIRLREDGTIALGSKKDNELSFATIDAMVRYYEKEPLILYSNGRMAGTTRLRAPPPGMVRKSSQEESGSRRSSSQRPSGSTEDLRVPAISPRAFSSRAQSSLSRRIATSTPNIDHALVHSSLNARRLSSDPSPNFKPTNNSTISARSRYLHASSEEIWSRCSCGSRELALHRTGRQTPPVPDRPPATLANGKVGPSLTFSVANVTSTESTFL